jgi:hypothetical protein
MLLENKKDVNLRRIDVKSQPKSNSWQVPISKKPNTKQGWQSDSNGRASA